MASSLLHPPAHLSPAMAVQLSQQAPTLLRKTPSSISSYSVGSLFTAAESPELWMTYENLMMSCLRTGDDESAHLCLERLTERFGVKNERLMGLRGLFQEAIAADDAALKQVLEEYDVILAKDPSNIPVSKRRIALFKSLKKPTEAITALSQLLDASPVDAEAWAELADLYVSQGMYQQGIFALEEVLLITPNAWNIHARLGEVLFMAAGADNAEKYLAESLRRFCRSIELCDEYLRGYYGLKLVSNRLLTLPATSRQSKSDAGLPVPDPKTIERLNEIATSKLSEIVRRAVKSEVGWEGYDKAELIAAQELLNRDATTVTRHTPPNSIAYHCRIAAPLLQNPTTKAVELCTPCVGTGPVKQDETWDPVYSDEIEPSESASASRPRTSTRYRTSESRPPASRGPTRRHTTTERPARRPPTTARIQRHPAPAPPSSVDPSDDYPGYGRGYPAPPVQSFGGRGSGPGYAPSTYSGPGGGGGPYAPPFGGAPNALTYHSPSGFPQYHPSNPFAPISGPGTGAGYFNNPHHPHSSAHSSSGGYGGHEMMAYPQHSNYAGGYPGYMPPGMQQGIPPAMSPHQMQYYPSQWNDPTALPADPEVEKKLLAIEELMRNQAIDYEKAQKALADRDAKDEREKREAAAAAEAAAKQAEDKAAWEKRLEEEKKAAEKKGAEAQLKKAEAEAKKKAEEEAKKADEEARKAMEKALEEKLKEEAIKEAVAAAEAAGEKAKAEAIAEAEKAKAEAIAEAEKAKAEAIAEAEKAKEAAVAAVTATLTPDAKQKPIKFKDAVGRKFSFPFHLCATWAGMEELIRQAFLHVEVIGPHVADGHYDLIGPNGEIILPQVWETMIEPDWAITMHMWPMPEAPKPAPPPPPPAPPIAHPRTSRDGHKHRPFPPSGHRGPAPQPPANFQPRDTAATPGGPPVIVMPNEGGPAPKPARRKTEPAKGVLGWMAGKPSKPSGKGIYPTRLSQN
ncbi:hypothetical protein B7494_g7005 [Chlorociboria aeruginascens]|nr:hypothetical protein B7494_g7005 [Chlorociboria aeruginascens]